MKSLPITVFKDAGHETCLDTIQIITGIMIILVSAPILFYIIRQNTTERSTYGGEVVATRIAI